ncbi:MAG: phosphoribosylformylglycinamidine synthase subunit PurQ [Acidobacteriota bacterium]
MKLGVVVFPGSNCDHDIYHVFKHQLGVDVELVWHKATRMPQVDAVILPGGFSYGDYLRSGAIAAHSPIMGAVRRLAEAGAPVLGICNGFQILCESGLLPGALLRNAGLRFICKNVPMRVERAAQPFTALYSPGETVAMTIANFDGNYCAPAEVLDEIEAEKRVILRYVDNPNGSARNIAGLVNARGNVMGMMPHPERVSDPLLGPTDGFRLLRSLAAHAAGA